MHRGLVKMRGVVCVGIEERERSEEKWKQQEISGAVSGNQAELARLHGVPGNMVYNAENEC